MLEAQRSTVRSSEPHDPGGDPDIEHSSGVVGEGSRERGLGGVTVCIPPWDPPAPFEAFYVSLAFLKLPRAALWGRTSGRRRKAGGQTDRDRHGTQEGEDGIWTWAAAVK